MPYARLLLGRHHPRLVALRNIPCGGYADSSADVCGTCACNAVWEEPAVTACVKRRLRRRLPDPVWPLWDLCPTLEHSPALRAAAECMALNDPRDVPRGDDAHQPMIASHRPLKAPRRMEIHPTAISRTPRTCPLRAAARSARSPVRHHINSCTSRPPPSGAASKPGRLRAPPSRTPRGDTGVPPHTAPWLWQRRCSASGPRRAGSSHGGAARALVQSAAIGPRSGEVVQCFLRERLQLVIFKNVGR